MGASKCLLCSTKVTNDLKVSGNNFPEQEHLRSNSVKFCHLFHEVKYILAAEKRQTTRS